MTKTELRQYQAIQHEAEDIKERITRLRSKLESPAMAVLSHAPKGKGKQADKTGAIVAQIDALTQEYRVKWEEQVAAFKRIEEAISGLADPTERTLMRLRYLDGMSWEHICVKVGYSWRQVHYIHRKVLADIA